MVDVLSSASHGIGTPQNRGHQEQRQQTEQEYVTHITPSFIVKPQINIHCLIISRSNNSKTTHKKALAH
jgi:hypothetical protein